MLHSGKLNKKIIIEVVTETRTNSGAISEAWATHAEMFASITPVNGKEYFAAAQVQAENIVKFRIRYQSGLTTKMRILYNTNYYDIKSILNEFERNDVLILMASEYVD